MLVNSFKGTVKLKAPEDCIVYLSLFRDEQLPSSCHVRKEYMDEFTKLGLNTLISARKVTLCPPRVSVTVHVEDHQVFKQDIGYEQTASIEIPMNKGETIFINPEDPKGLCVRLAMVGV